MGGVQSMSGGKRIIICLAMILSLLVTGCASVFNYDGRNVPAGNRIALRDTETSGNWQTRDLTVNYRYHQDGDQLKMEGRVNFADYLQYAFHSMQYFHLGIMLLSADGKVLGTKGLATGQSSDRTRDALRFDELINLPEGTTSMSFYYTGQARSTGSEGGGGTTELWHYPF
jgi:hypothetical protein